MPTATLQVTVPTVAQQPVGITIQRRTIAVSGTLADGSQDVAPTTNDVNVQVAWQAGVQVTVSVVEVPEVGKASLPCSITFDPQSQHQAVAADPTQFSVKVLSIQ
jgi:hypothetical protein